MFLFGFENEQFYFRHETNWFAEKIEVLVFDQGFYSVFFERSRKV